MNKYFRTFNSIETAFSNFGVFRYVLTIGTANNFSKCRNLLIVPRIFKYVPIFFKYVPRFFKYVFVASDDRWCEKRNFLLWPIAKHGDENNLLTLDPVRHIRHLAWSGLHPHINRYRNILSIKKWGKYKNPRKGREVLSEWLLSDYRISSYSVRILCRVIPLLISSNL